MDITLLNGLKEMVKNNAISFRALQAKTLEEQSKIQSDSRCRYRELFRLPYYDPVVTYVIDPMHNLMLGIAK